VIFDYSDIFIMLSYLCVVLQSRIQSVLVFDVLAALYV
jgi:hypothetical protein